MISGNEHRVHDWHVENDENVDRELECTSQVPMISLTITIICP